MLGALMSLGVCFRGALQAWRITNFVAGAVWWVLAHADLISVMAPLLLIASLCIVAGAVMAPLLLIASLCIVAGAVMAPLLLIASLCIVAGAVMPRITGAAVRRRSRRSGYPERR